MRNYMIRRAGHSILIVAGLMALLFLLTHVMGDPVLLMVGDDAPQEQIDAIRKRFGYDKPLYAQFFDFYGKLLTGDFGKSLRHNAPAIDLVLERLPNTAMLAVTAWGIAVLGIPLGMVAARRPRSIYDRIVNVLSFGGISTPEFWLGLMLILLVAVQWGILPTSGFGGLTSVKYLVLPALALMPRPLGRIAQITRASMIDEMEKGYVATARAKGLAERTILYLHILKNAAIAIVTLGGGELAGFMNGSTTIEVVFGWPGLGLLLIQAISQRDLPVITAAIFVIAIMVMVINLTVDLLYTWLDPRVQYR